MAWVDSKYSSQNLNVTTEGFEQALPSKVVNEEGVIVNKGYAVKREPQKLEEFLGTQNTTTRNQIEGAVRSYVSNLKSQNFSMPATSQAELEAFYRNTPPSPTLGQDKENSK